MCRKCVLWAAGIPTISVLYLPWCIGAGSTNPGSGYCRGRNTPRLVTAQISSWRMLKTSGIIWHLQEGGLDGAVPPLTPCQGLSDRGWEKNQGWKQPPKTSFPCDLNDNCSCPASWLDWETSFSPCYPIIQMTHVYLKWSLLYISCQPRYTFNSKKGINWPRCKKDVFAVPVSVKLALKRKKLCKSRHKC